MSSHVTTAGAKQTATVLEAPPSLRHSLVAFWSGLRATVHTIFHLRPITVRPARPTFPGSGNPEPTVAPNPALQPGTEQNDPTPPVFVTNYWRTLEHAWHQHDWSDVVNLQETLRRCWRENRQVFLCGNGGSAANAIHLANDFLYGVDKATGRGLRVTALPSNAAVLTCLANDIAYEDIFAQQLTVLAQPGDVLLAFSGSGNSPNIVKVLTRARELGVTSFAVLGYSGGRARALADHPIYFPVHDMQVAEDLQMMVGHMIMQHLSRTGR